MFQLGFSSSIENKALPGVPALPNLCLPVRLRVPVKIGEASISFGCGIGSQIWIQTYWRAYSESSLEAAQLQGAPKKQDGALPVLDSCARGGNVVS